MGIATVSPAADYSAFAVGNTLFPVTGGLTDLFYFGGTQAQSAKNLISGGTDLAVVGAPTINANSATLGSVQYTNAFDLGHVLKQSHTVIVVAKAPINSITYNGEQLYGGFGAAGGALSLGHFSNDTKVRLGRTGTPFFYDIASVNPDPTKFGFYAVRHTATVAQLAQGFGGSLFHSGAQVDNRAGDETVAPRIGTQKSSGGAASVNDVHTEIAMFAVYDRSLTDAEVAKVYAGLQGVFTRKGITTL